MKYSETKDVITQQLDHCVDFERESAGSAVRVEAGDLRQVKTGLKQHQGRVGELLFGTLLRTCTVRTYFGWCDSL